MHEFSRVFSSFIEFSRVIEVSRLLLSFIDAVSRNIGKKVAETRARVRVLSKTSSESSCFEQNIEREHHFFEQMWLRLERELEFSRAVQEP